MEAATEFVPQQLTAIDITIVATYMLGTFILGNFFGKYVNSAGDFFVAGKALPFWAIGMSIVVTDIGATDFIATAGAGYTYGIAAANFDWMGSMPAMVFAAFLFVPYYWRAGVFTIPEFLGRRYNAAVQVLHATIWGVFLVVMLAVMLWLTAQMLETILGWNPYFCVWLVALVTGAYCFSGGLNAVVMTDAVQLVVMFVGGIALALISVHEAGGFFAMRETILAMPGKELHFDLLLPQDSGTPYPWSGIVFGLGIVMATGYMAGNQAIVQRSLGARSEWDAKGGMLFAGFLKVFIPLMIIIPGLAALAILPPMENGDQAVPTMIREILPPGLRGLMFAALLAALMSSVSSSLNSASTLWASDIYGRLSELFTGKAPTDRTLLFLGRGLTLVFILVSAWFAPYLAGRDTMYNFIQTSLAMFQGPVFAILLLGILWRRATQWGGLAGLVLGVAFTTILNNTEGVFPSEDPFLYIAWWSFVFSLAVTMIVSLLTPKDPDEKVRGLIFGQIMQDGQLQRVLKERVENGRTS
ncbi:MAG: hypothetical protein RLZZ303_3539 [Candidatus Hydrogenedentota bacterium]